MKNIENKVKDKVVPIFVSPKLHKRLWLIKLENNCKTLEEAIEFLAIKPKK